MYRTLGALFITVILLSGCGAATAEENSDDKKMQIINKVMFGNGIPDRCEGRQWKNPQEARDCQFPSPPIGRWKAVYTVDFARAYSLPLDNISTDLSLGVDYMEIDVMPLRVGGTACLVNMLIKKPHDIALYDPDRSDTTQKAFIANFPLDRRLTHLIDLQKYKGLLKPTISFLSGSRDYTNEKKGYRSSTFAMYAENVLPNYDYISANANCTLMSMHYQYYPNGYSFWINKASVWGRYEMLHLYIDAPDWPRGENFDSSFFSINIPHELVSAVFEGVPMGGQ